MNISLNSFALSESAAAGLRAVPARGSVGRRGFTFTEIMFAVVIMGIGFIMIAAVFPVAIRMNQQSSEETLAVTAAQKAIQSIRSQMTATLFRPTAAAVTTYTLDTSSTTANLSQYHAPYFALGEADAGATPVISTSVAREQFIALRGDLISSIDRRFGFAMAYSRDNALPYRLSATNKIRAAANEVKVIVVVAQVREREAFDENDINLPGQALTTFTNQYYRTDASITPPTLSLKRLNATFTAGVNGAPDRVALSVRGSTVPTSIVGPGSYIIIADASNSGDANAIGTSTLFNGKIVRVADASEGLTDTFDLQPGQDFGGGAVPGQPVQVLVLGRPLLDPSSAYSASTNPYTSVPMDVAVYTTTVGLRP